MPLISTYYDGPVTESDRAKNPAGRAEYGVYGNEDFRVMAHPSIPYAVLVKKGKAHGHGVTDEAEIDQVVNCPSLASGVRWDLIVVRRNWQPELGGPSTLEVIEVGTNPIIPDPPIRKVGPGVEDDQPIALVKWQGGTSAPVEFRDLRVWSNNAGLFAVDALARKYLEKIGTEVRVLGEVWSYQRLSANETDWVKVSEAGRLPIFGVGNVLTGSAPSTQTHFLVQSGTSVSNADDSGYARITFPKPFPNGVLYVSAENGDASIDQVLGRTLSLPVAGAPHWPNPVGKESFVYTVLGDNGQRLPRQLHRANWIAIGW